MTTGRKPVENFTIETISELNDRRLTEFRQLIFSEDLKIDPELIHADKPHKWWIENFDKKIAEDAYKYCDRKWNTLGTDNIEAIIEDGKVVGMSGCRIYGNYLRTSMHLYLLKRVRSKYPGIKYLKDGWYSRHINFANEKNLDGMFFTVYAYSRKLQALINNHRNKTISLVDKKHLLYMDDIKEVGQYEFYNVPQTFFFYKLKDKEFDIDQILPNQ